MVCFNFINRPLPDMLCSHSDLDSRILKSRVEEGDQQRLRRTR
jgi:hypothetical protein